MDLRIKKTFIKLTFYASIIEKFDYQHRPINLTSFEHGQKKEANARY